jgi:TPR repeat protein
MKTTGVRAAECGPPVAGGLVMQMAFENDAISTGIPLPESDSSGDELLRMGLLYSTGQGGAPLDYVSAHMLFNLAAMRGSEEAKKYRRELSAEMDRDMVNEAQRAAREWLARA